MRRRERGPDWPRRLVTFSAADWPGPVLAGELAAAGYTERAPLDDERVAAAVALARWRAARAVFAERCGDGQVVTVIGGRRYRRPAILDSIVWDARERQPGLDRLA